MKYKELLDQIASEHQLKKPKARKIVDTVLKTLLDEGLSPEGFQSPLLKVFSKDIPASTKQNPETGEVQERPASKRLIIKPGKKYSEDSSELDSVQDIS